MCRMTAFPKSRSSRVAFLLPELLSLAQASFIYSLFNKYLTIYTRLKFELILYKLYF